MNSEEQRDMPPPGWVERLAVDTAYFGLLEHAPVLSPVARRVVQTGAFMFASEWRKNLIFNAGLALGPRATRAARIRCAFQMMGAMQQFIGDVFIGQHACKQASASPPFVFEGAANYLEVRQLKRGVILAGIHMGAFELALAALRGIEGRVHVMYQPDPMPRFERARSELRRRLGIVEHRMSDGIGAWSALRDALAANEAVLVNGDRVIPGTIGSPMPFLGLDRAELPTGVVRLAAVTGAPIVPTYSVRERRGLRIWIDPMITVEKAPLAMRDVADHPAQRALVASMERAIRTHPNQWMPFADLRPSSDRGASA